MYMTKKKQESLAKKQTQVEDEKLGLKAERNFWYLELKKERRLNLMQTNVRADLKAKDFIQFQLEIDDIFYWASLG